MWPKEEVVKLNLLTEDDLTRQEELLEEAEKERFPETAACNDPEDSTMPLPMAEESVESHPTEVRKCAECDEEHCSHFYWPEGEADSSESDEHCSLNSDTRSRCTADTDSTVSSCFDDWVFEAPVVNIWFDLTSLSAEDFPNPWTFWDELDELKRLCSSPIASSSNLPCFRIESEHKLRVKQRIIDVREENEKQYASLVASQLAATNAQLEPSSAGHSSKASPVEHQHVDCMMSTDSNGIDAPSEDVLALERAQHSARPADSSSPMNGAESGTESVTARESLSSLSVSLLS